MFIACYHAVAMNYILNVILEIIDRFITSKFPVETVTKCNIFIYIYSVTKENCLGGALQKQLSVVSLTTLAFYKIQNSNFFCWNAEAVRKSQM